MRWAPDDPEFQRRALGLRDNPKVRLTWPLDE
jgi:hypothetical protein